jgi:hypothetical protein
MFSDGGEHVEFRWGRAKSIAGRLMGQSVLAIRSPYTEVKVAAALAALRRLLVSAISL